MTDARAAYDLASTAFNKQGYLYNGDSGLRKWRVELAKVALGQIKTICFVGDSITEGCGSSEIYSEWPTKGYVGQIRSALAKKYGDQGLGLIPTYYPTGGPLWTYSNWPYEWGYGITKSGRTSTSSGSTATLSFKGVGIKLFVYKGPDGGTFTYSIDGGSAVSVDTYSASISPAVSIDINGLSDGNHSIVLTSTVTTGKCVRLIGAAPVSSASSGVRVIMAGRYGCIASDQAFTESLALSLNVWSPSLTVIALTANDFGNPTQTDLASYKSSLQTIITRAKQFGDVLLATTGLRTASGTIPQAEYNNVNRILAKENDVAYLDLYAKWGNNGTYAKDTLGVLYDFVHPNEVGHKDIATAILKVIDEY